MPLHGIFPSGPLSVAIYHLLCCNILALAWALAPLLGEVSISAFHPKMDHTAGYSLTQCPPTVWVGPGTPTFHGCWP